METIKQLLIRHGFSFKKQFGQNFITDVNLLKSIVNGAGITEKDVVVEIGPGAGTLTREIASQAKKVVCYEIDKNLEPVLEDTLSGFNNVEVVFNDVMKVPIKDLEKSIGERYTVVANLPYYITTPIIMRFIEQAKKVKSLVIMVQEEVADRLCAKENTAEYGAITAAIGVKANAKIIKKVPKTMFLPMPKVDSAVVKIDIVENKFNVLDEKVYKDVLHSAFNNRRKMLANNLMQIFKYDRQTAEEILLASDIPLTARGETLSVEKFVLLANTIVEKNQ